MGSSTSKSAEVETETNVENTIMQITGDVSLQDKELLLMLFIICVIKIMEIIYMVYKIYHKQLKKKFEEKFTKSPA